MNSVSSYDHSPHSQNKPVVWTRPPDCPRTVSEWGRAGASSFGLKDAQKALPQRQHASHLVTSKVTVWCLLSKTFPDHVFNLQFPIPFPIVLFSLAFVIIQHTLFSNNVCVHLCVHPKNGSSIRAESLGTCFVHYCVLVPRIKE